MSVSFTDQNNGWAVGGSGIVVHSENGGETWEEQQSNTSLWLNSICFTDSQHGWIAGSDGIILHTDNGGMVGIDDYSAHDPKLGILCYPNPTSSITKIRYSLPAGQAGMTELYTISGMQIRELVDAVKMPGLHEIEIDVSDLPGGVYFVRVQAGNEFAIAKLLVVH